MSNSSKQRFAVIPSGQCVACGCCAKSCPRGAISIQNGCFAIVNRQLCVGCGICQRACPASIISIIQEEPHEAE